MIKRKLPIQFIKKNFYAFLIMFGTGLSILLPGAVNSQGVTQVNITGVPSVLSSPYADQLEENFRNGRYQVMVNYNGTSPGETEFVFDFILTKEGRELLNITSDPVSFRPGSQIYSSFFEEVPFPEDADEVIDRLGNRLRNQVVQAGTIPEGRYTIRIEARPAERNSGISSSPGVAIFNVRYPQPPVLVSPSDESNVVQEMPTFTWTPVVAEASTSFEYEFLLVEVLRNQNPLQAMQSNRAHARVNVIGRTTIPYTTEYLPLEEGVTYAWQVTARDVQGQMPVRNDGSSEIHTFTYKQKMDDERAGRIRELEEITLVPDFARLTNLNRLEIREDASAYILDGRATLHLQFDGADEMQTTVGVRNLRLQKQSLNNPVILGGTVRGSAPGLEELLGNSAQFVKADEVQWRLGEGVTATAQIETPSGGSFSASGRINLQRYGLSGSVMAQAGSDEILARIGEAPFEVIITSIFANYPEGRVNAEGHVETLSDVRCDVPSIPLERDQFMARIDCEVDQSVPLVGGSDKLQLTIDDMTGQFSGSWSGEQPFEYAISMRSGLGLKLDNPGADDDEYCGASGRLTLSHEEELSASNFQTDCVLPDPTLDLGILNLSFQNPELVSLGYSDDEWDFDFRFDADLFLPPAPNAKMPRLEDVSVTPDGIQFPEVAFNETDLQPNMKVDLDPFQISLNRFSLENSLFPWFNWDENSVGPWDFSMDASVQFPDSNEYPTCLRNASLELTNAGVEGQSVTGDLQMEEFGQCRWEFGAGYALDINQIEGYLHIHYNDGELQPEGDLNLDALVELGEPFSCEGTSNEVSADDIQFTATSNGFTSEIENFVPGCPVEVGPYSAEITDSDLSLSYVAGGSMDAEISAEADLDLGTDLSASGSFTLNLMTGEFSELDFDLQGPFEWSIPKENSVLVFEVDQAKLSEEGIFIDGRQTLLLGENDMGVTFDELLVNWQTFNVKSGRLILDDQISFEAGIDPDTNGLDYSVTRRDSLLSFTPGVLLNMAGTITVDSLGLRASGSSTGELNFGDLSLDDIEVVYSDDFAMGLDPFGVRKGQAEIYKDDQRIAVIDNSGFRPDIAFFGDEFLPDRIPLPTEEVAYLQIRQDDDLVVQTSQQGDGSYKIETLPDQPLQLVVPALQGNQPEAPALDVTLNELLVDPSTGNYISGTVTADVPEGNPDFDLEPLGIPLTLNEIIYTTQNLNDNEFSALFLDGNLTLLDEDLGDSAHATLFIQSDGRVQGGVTIPNLDAEIPLDPNSNMVVFHVDSLNGNVDIPLFTQEQPNFVFDLSGGFQINNFDGDAVAAAGLEARFNDQGFSVTNFDASALAEDATLDLEYFSFTIDQISTLSLDYTETDGFSYFADLDFTLGMQLPDGESIEIPLKNVDIRDDLGFVIPQQDIHDGSSPVLDAPEFDLGIFRLKPLAFRMEKDTINVHNLSAGDLLDLLPEIDLELTFPSYSQTAPAMSQQSLTLNGVGFSDGILSGSIIPFSVSDDPVFLPIGPAGLYIDQFGGSFFETDENTQGIDVQVSGHVGMPDFFSGSGEVCNNTRVDLSLNSEGGFNGTVEDFMPCGQLELGPLSLGFGSSILDFSYSEGEQSATLDGTGTAEIERDDLSPVSASGELLFDLLEGEIISGSLGLNDPFTWGLPADDPFFELNVQTAQLDSDGLKFTGSGGLNVGDGSVSTTFNNFAINLRDGSISGGSVDILNEFAIDVGFSPTEWQIADPDDQADFAAGVRFVMPQNLSLEQSGLIVDGQSSASLKYGDESYDALSLDFVNMALGVEPVGVTDGRADLLLEEDGSTTRLAWYDSDGFHADNLAGAISVPDTLGLPTKDVAYIVLKDDQGQNLVQSQDVSEGLEIYTDQPVPLVLAALEDSQGDSPQVDVSFSEVVINDAYEITGGSISVDVSDTPLNLTNYGDFPIGLTAIHFQKLPEEPYKLYADAKLSLPESLQDLEVIVEQLILGEGGFEDAVFSAGQFTATHTEGDEPVIAAHEFANGAFNFAVRGVDLEFGDTPSYKFSGDVSSSFITSAEGDTANVHFAADYTAGDWAFTMDADHITPQELPIGQAKLILDDLGTEVTQDDFDLVLDGRFALSELTGDDLEIGIEGLRIGTSGVSVDHVNTDGLTPQSLSLFGQTDNFTIADLGLDITAENHLLLAMDGSFSFMDRSFDFNDFKLGTDGTFEIGDGNVNLINPSEPVQLMDEYLVLTALQIGIEDNKATLTASGDATLPDPLSSTSTIDISVNHQGEASVSGPSFTLQNASVDLGDLAEFKLTGAGLQVDDIHQSQITLYASAEVDIDGDVIQLGEPGSPGTWGVRYRMNQQKLEWDITNMPTFEFEAGFFALTISNASLTDPQGEAFGVSIDANASFLLDGVGGAGLQLEEFEISTGGIESMGNVTGGSFEFAGAVSVEVGSFDWGQDEEITLVQQSGSEEDPDSEEVNVQVDEFLRFGNDNGSAVNITIEGGFSGGIEEIFYYRNSESLYLNIEGVDVKFNDTARLFASMEYENQPDGFMLRVAGGGSIETEAGQSYGLAALGRMSTLNDEFSFGIFVAVQAEIPLFPGVISLTEVGGGFFYNATNQDFEDVVSLTDYEFYNDKTPWEDKSGDYDFAVALNAGASLIGMGGTYAVEGRTLILITDQWFAMDVQGTLLNQGNRLSAGMYIEVVWDPSLSISGGVGANVDYDMVLSGGLEIDFFVIEDYENSTPDDMEVVWGINGDGYLDIVGGIAEAEVGFMISADGFYTEILVTQGFDVWVVSVSSSWEGALWWVYEEQFGAYVEIGFDATLFKVASVGGTLKGALIVDDGYLVYASASAYVSVFMVFEGRVSVWVSMENGRFDGGRGSNSEYESMVADAREQAQNMEDKMNEALAAAEDLQNVPEVARISEEDLAAAGQNLLSAHPMLQAFYLNAMIATEETLVDNAPQIHNDIIDVIVNGESRPTESDYNISSLRSDMDQEIDYLTDIAGQVQSSLNESYTLSLEWEETAGELMDDVINNPVQNVSMEWDQDSDSPPSFEIDQDQAASNQQSLEELKQAIDALDEQYMAAIDSVANYINRIEEALSLEMNIDMGTYNPLTNQFEGGSSSYRPSANMVSDQYAEASKAIENFYGNYVAHRWYNHKWASEKLSDYQSLRGGSIRDAVIEGSESMLEERLYNITNVNFQDGTYPTVQLTNPNLQPSSSVMDEIKYVAVEREYFIHLMNPNLTNQQINNRKNNFSDEMDDFSRDEVFTNFIIKGIEFWHDMPTLGYESIRDSSQAQAERMASLYQDRIEPMQTAHEAFTATVDDIYKVKASLTMTLHGMVDVYAARRADLAGDSAAVALNEFKDNLESVLTPPTITGIQVSKDLNDYSNKVTLSWNAQHNSGDVVENSYHMSRGSNSSVLAENMLSTGDKSEVTRYLFKESQNELDRNMKVVIRARGPSGTAISRPATFNAAVDQYGSTQGLIEGYWGTTDDIDEPDTSPPARPLISMSYKKSESTSYNYSNGTFQQSTQTNYWTNQTDEIEFIAISFDDESDISAFEYAVGSSEGGTDIVDWTSAQGRRVTRDLPALSNMAGADNLAQELTIRNLNLSEGPHYLSVRAVNGAGLKSSEKEVSYPVQYDGDPPTAPSITAQDITMPNVNGYSSDFQWAVHSAPEYEDPPAKTVETPEMTIQWSAATDLTSGIDGYEYTVSSFADSESAFADPTGVESTSGTEATIKGDPLSFKDSVYVHVRAVNNAGSYSENSAVYGPVTPQDPTRPWTPKIKATGKPDGIGFYLFRPSLDWESDIDRYEFTATTGLFSSDLFPWTEVSTSSINFGLFFYALAANQGESMQGASASYLDVPLNNIPENESVMLKVRTINEQGMASGTGISGMVTYDTSPPENPTISLSESGNSIDIDVSDIYDPESGISKVEYRIVDTGSPGSNQTIVDWTDFIDVNGIKQSALSGSRSAYMGGHDYFDLKVFIRVTNGNGKQTTVSQSPVFIFTNTNYQNYNYTFTY